MNGKPTEFYTPEFRSAVLQADETFRDYLHDNKTFVAYPSREAAVAAARSQLEEDVAERDCEDLPANEKWVITKWSLVDSNNRPYDDGGVWYEVSDGEEGRVVIHTILLA